MNLIEPSSIYGFWLPLCYIQTLLTVWLEYAYDIGVYHSLCFKHAPLSTKSKDLEHNQDNMSSEWVLDCCLAPIHQFCSYIMARKKVNFQWDDEVRFVLDKHAELDFYSASSLKQVRGYTCRSTRTYYTDSEPTSLCSFYLMLRA
jgi:hypothetical protein